MQKNIDFSQKKEYNKQHRNEVNTVNFNRKE